MGFTQQDERRRRRANRHPENVQRTITVRRDDGVHVHHPVIAGTENFRFPVSPLKIAHPTMVWALVCSREQLAFFDFDDAAAAARWSRCPEAHHVQLVPFKDTDAGTRMTYHEWLLSQSTPQPDKRTFTNWF